MVVKSIYRIDFHKTKKEASSYDKSFDSTLSAFNSTSLNYFSLVITFPLETFYMPESLRCPWLTSLVMIFPLEAFYMLNHQDAHGSHQSPKKQAGAKVMTIYVCKMAGWKLLLFPLAKGCGLSSEQTWDPFTQGCMCQAWLRYWSSGSMHVSSMYLNQLFTAWKRRGHSLIKKIASSCPKDTFSQVWLIWSR